MTKFQRVSLFLLRIASGLFFFYAGITKIIMYSADKGWYDPQFSAAFYLKGAKLFTAFYQALLSPGLLPSVSFVNKWGLTLLGISLILGIGVRLSSVLGVILMLLYYFPLGFPYPDAHSFIVDQHIMYATSLLVLASFRAGRVMGLEEWCSNLPICSKIPKYRSWLG